MRKRFSRRSSNEPRSTYSRFQLWRHSSGHFFEELEDRRLLSISSGGAYDQVSPDWFEVDVDQSIAASLDFVGPLTQDQFNTRSALFSKSDATAEPQNQWIVRLTPEATSLVGEIGDARTLLNHSAGKFRIIRGLGLPGQLLVESSDMSAAEAEYALESNPLVAYFSSNGSVSGQIVPDDADFSELWGLNNTGQTNGTINADIDAPEAWDCLLEGSATVGNMNVVVAVIDSGIDYTHPDLYKNIWINQGEIPSGLKSSLVDTDSDGLITFYDLNDPANEAYVVDSNATGYIDAGDLLADANWANGVDEDGDLQSDASISPHTDDLVGWNFSGTGSGNQPLDGSRHGTHVAGTIAAVGDNQTGTTGVAWRTSIMPLKFLDDSNRGTRDEAILAINYVTLMRQTYGVNVVIANNSWGYQGESDQDLRDVIEAGGKAGILFVAASGNGDILGHGVDNDADLNHAFYPASEDLDNVLAVAASDDDDRLARFSNYGTTSVDIAAPGVSIFSTEPGEDYRSRYGTSMAAPHVSGVAALIWSAVPDATPAEVKEAIILGGDPVADFQDKIASGRRLNAHGSLLVDTAAPRATLIDAPNVDGPGVTETVITVEYRDDRLVDWASVLNSQLLVTDVLDPSSTFYATFPSTDVTEDSPVCTVTYHLAAPDGVWGIIDDGDYEVSLESGQIADSKSNWALATSLGTFNVDTAEGLIRVTSFEDASDADPGDGIADDGTSRATLRAAVMEANAQTTVDNVIRLARGNYTLSVAGRGEDAAAIGDLDITHNLTIRGVGADVTTIDAVGLDRVFHIHPGVTVELRDMTLTGGDPHAEGGGIFNEGDLAIIRCQITASTATTYGGALANAAGATATLESCALSGNPTVEQAVPGNTAENGGAIGNQGSLTVVSCTLSGNSATTDGGGIDNQGAVTVTNATISNNSAETGGGICNSGTGYLRNTIVAGNFASTDPDFAGAVTTSETNLIGSVGTSTGWDTSDLLDTDPGLGPLQDNTGPTLTHALLLDSPAIDAGANPEPMTTDQRGVTRPVDGDYDGVEAYDIGAVERYFGEIHGVLFQDDTPNGIQEIDELGQPDKVVYLDENNNGAFDEDEPSTRTMKDISVTKDVDEAGNYSFYHVTPGIHRVTPVIQDGWEQTYRTPRPTIERVSDSWEIVEVEGDARSYTSSVSADGRYIAFASWASNLMPGDTNDECDIFVHDCQTGISERISSAFDSTQANDFSFNPSISGDGRYVTFASWASNLVPGDTNGTCDVFVHDRQTGTIERISVSNDGSQSNERSELPSISANGRYVTFWSDATNLVPGDTNRDRDVFVHDRQLHTTERVSVAFDGSEANNGSWVSSISADGRYVAFQSDATNLVPGDTDRHRDVFVHDRQLGATERVSVAFDGSEANDDSWDSSISADGRYVAFQSDATNLVLGDTNDECDIFVHDCQLGTTERVSVASDGTEADNGNWGVAISADGRYVTFSSDATMLVPGDINSATNVFVFDRQTGTTNCVSVASDGSKAGGSDPSISADGRFVSFDSSASNLVAGDTNDTYDIFVYDHQTRRSERVSFTLYPRESSANSFNPTVSGDGRYVAFESYASSLVPGDMNVGCDIFVHDRQTGLTERVSIGFDGTQANSSSYNPSISADGRYVAFQSGAINLVPNDTNGESDIFVHDRQLGTTERVSVAADDTQADDYSGYPSISADGRYVAFSSTATNLVPGDTNLQSGVFVFDRQMGTTNCVSVASDGSKAEGGDPSISADGRYVAFQSGATNLVPSDTNGQFDIFVHDRQLGAIERVSVASDGTEADGHCQDISISADGRYVAFSSSASNLVPGDTNHSFDVFIHDRQTDMTQRVSVASDGEQGNDRAYSPSLSADGRYVVFSSDASNLVPGDTNLATDVFVFDQQTGMTQRVNAASNGTQGNASAYTPSLSGDGRYVAFHSSAFNLVLPDTNGMTDIFVAINLPAWQAGTSVANVGVGESIVGMEMALKPLHGKIQGRVFRDLDRNGASDSNEVGQVGWTVFLDLNDNGTADDGEPTALTGSFGDYVIDVEPFRTYTVATVPQDYWLQTQPTQTDGGTWTVEINAGPLADDIDFGFYYAGPDAQSSDVVTGTLYRDLNANGLQDDGEPGLSNWTVELNSEDGQVHDTRTTGVDGSYSFEGVTARNYTVQAQTPTGWMLTTPLENSLTAKPFGEGEFDQTQAVTTGDFDGDGDLDLAVSHGEYVTLRRNDGTGSFAFWQELKVGAGAGALQAGDLNGDGRLDLVVAVYHESQLAILLNQGTPMAPMTEATQMYIGSVPRSLTVGQFNDDNGNGQIDDNDYLDVAIAHEDGGSDALPDDNQVTILLGLGDGTFQPPTYVAAGDNPVAIITAQFNDDNHDGWINERDAADLAVANQDSNDVTVLINNGNGSFDTGVPVLASDAQDARPFSLAAADLDRDGDIDLAVADFNSACISILKNAGNGSFVRLPESLPAGTDVQAVIAADIEGDGDADLIITNNTAEHLGILRNFTDPITQEIQFGPLESSGVANFSGGPSYSVVAAYLDADSDLDLAVAIGETGNRLQSQYNETSENYVSVVLNDVFEGAHHITVTGIEPVPELNFGVRPAGNLPTIVNRQVFYNNSWFDGNDPAANAHDDAAIATDKIALFPSQVATFANYTSYTRGINGIMIDVADAAVTATIDDFSFKVGNGSDLSTWTTLTGADLPTVTTRTGEGAGGSDRVTLTWPDNTVEQQWLQITALAGGSLGLVTDDVFYFGNAIGDSGDGNPAGVAITFVSEELGARQNRHGSAERAPVDDAYDYNRDSLVDSVDEQAARDSGSSFLTGLNLITAPAGTGGTGSSPTTGTGTPTNPTGLSLSIIAGHHFLLPDTANQEIEILVEGGEDIEGLELFVQIADGGPEVEGTIDAPAITGADLLTGTIFTGNNTGQAGSVLVPQIAQFGTTTNSGTVDASGLLATLTIDTTGFDATSQENSWTLLLTPTMAGNSAFPGTPATVVNGTIVIRENRPPTADAGGPYTVIEGAAVTLDATASSDEDQSSNTLTYAWDFDGDNQYDDATGMTPSFSAATLDGYIGHSVTIGLRVTDDEGATDETTTTVQINNVAPTVRIVGAPINSPEGTRIELTSTTTDPGAADSHACFWAVTKDGASYASGTEPAFSFTPMQSGSYEVALAVTDDDGGIGTHSQTIEVVNVAFGVSIDGAPTSSPEGTEITLSSTVNDPSGANDHTYAWLVTKDADQFATGDQADLAFTPDDDGSYVVTLTVSDSDGGIGTDNKTITVLNVRPDVSISVPPSEKQEGTTISLTSSVVDPGSTDVRSYMWIVSKVGVPVATGTTPGLDFTPDDNGSYTVTLNVTDDMGLGSDIVTFDVANVPPTISVIGSSTVDEDVDYTLTLGAVTDPGDDTVSQWIVTWGDGSSDTYSAGGNQTHVYANDGTYTITVDLVDEDGTYSDVESLNLTVNSVASPPVNLGQVDFRLLEHLSLADGGLFYKLETVRTGLLSLQVDAPDPSDSARLKLYDADPDSTPGLSPLIVSTLDEAGNQRIDLTVAAGATYYAEAFGDSTGFDLRLGNLVSYVGTEVTVHGTNGGDTFSFHATADREIAINGLAYDFDATQYETVVFSGGTGNDTATLTGGPDADVARLFPDHGTFEGNGFQVTVEDVTTITAHGGGGADSAFIYDSPGDDEFISRRGHGKMSGDGFVLEAFDFMNSYGYATTRDGGSDVAYMEDTSGGDKFKFDWPKPGQFFGKMYGGGVYYNRAKNFEQITATMSDDKDQAHLYDSQGDDTFYGQKDESRLVGDGFSVTIGGFGSLGAYASEGNDIAYLEDSDDDDTTRARPHKVTFWGGDDANPDYKITARRFDEYHFEGKHGGFDRAKLHDTALNDHAQASSNSTSLYANGVELDLLYEVVAFEWVKLYGTNNGSQNTVKKDTPLDFTLVYDDPALWDELP